MGLPPGWLTFARIADLTGGRVVAGDGTRPVGRVSIDSRTIEAGETFLAIAGPRFDGHDFVDQAVARGAGGLVVHRAVSLPATAPADLPVVVVSDTVHALQEAARAVRRASGARVVAITGSAGKTTTKEAAAAMLARRLATVRNRGNLNNHIGLPLSLLDLQHGASVAVMELGMNHAGEIRRLVGIAEPDVRVWTNVGTAHIEHFGSQEAIAEAKAEILDGAAPGHVLVANADDDRVMARAGRFGGRVITFGIDRRADVWARDVQSSGLAGTRATVETPLGTLTLDLRLPGRAHLANVLAATAVALLFDVPLADVAAAAAALEPVAHRGEVRRLARDVVVYDDCYNASPTALERTLETVVADPSGRRRVAFLGEMLELGEAAVPLHRASGHAVARAGIGELVTVGGAAARALGEAAREVAPTLAVTHVDTAAAAAALVTRVVRPGDLVLVKGSRALRMEQVVDRLQAEFA